MSTLSLFPTTIYKAPLISDKKAAQTLNKQLLKEIKILQKEDRAGVQWSKTNYPNGFTSYASANKMHIVSPTFAELELFIKAHVKKYVAELNLNINLQKLKMTTCWANIMSQGAVHSSHNHPQSTISGTYYVQMPPNSSALKIEDPRYSMFMSRPALHVDEKNQLYHPLIAESTDLILFESWLRHEVPINKSNTPRISVSFNY